jgi:hypothetical protein
MREPWFFMTEETEKIVEAVKEHAQEHYEEGGDVIVECYTDQMIAEIITDDTILFVPDALEQFGDLMGVWSERQHDAIICGYGSFEAYARRHDEPLR